MTENNRAHPRIATRLQARLLSVDGRCNLRCVITDLSEGGAGVSTSDYGLVPSHVFLMVDKTGEIFECEVRWRRGDGVGFRFIDSPGRACRKTLLELCRAEPARSKKILPHLPNAMRAMRDKVAARLFIVVAAPLFLLILGFGVGSNTAMPPYAAVFLDDQTKTYIALPCIEEWQRRTSEKVSTVRIAKLGEARKLNYKPDAACRDTGAVAPDGRSVSGKILETLGLLDPIEYWWDQPYRAEDGKVVYPKQEAAK